MIGENTPKEFTLTSDNYIDILFDWLPAQLQAMRQYQSTKIQVRYASGVGTLELQYNQTIGGEKFRIVDCTVMGDSGSAYYEPLTKDEEIILEYCRRVSNIFYGMERFNNRMNRQTPLELKMVFVDPA